MRNEEFKNILGCYQFDGYRQINPLNDEDGLMENSTSIHEAMHFSLSATSTYGMMLYALRKMQRNADWYYFSTDTRERCHHFIKYLVNSSIKVQEGLAVFFQWYYYYRSDEEKATRFINLLEKQNKTYYKYVEQFLFIIDKLKCLSLNEKELDVYVSLLYGICIDSLNINVSDLIANNITAVNKYKHFCSREGNAEKFIPNSALQHKLRRIQGKLAQDKLINALKREIRRDVFENNLASIEARSQQVKTYILILFPDEKDRILIQKAMDEIKVQENTLGELAFNELPMNVPLPKQILSIPSNEVTELIQKKTVGMSIFLLANIRLKGHGEEIRRINQFISEENNEYTPVTIYDLVLRRQFVSMVDNQSMKKVLSDKNLPVNIILNYKSYDYVHKQICYLGNYNHDIYIYCDRTYVGAKEYLSQFGAKNISFGALRYFSMYIVIFRLDGRTCFFLPVTQALFASVIDDISDTWPNFISVIQDDPIDGMVVVNPAQKSEIDIMISNLFFLGIDPADPQYKCKMNLKRVMVN